MEYINRIIAAKVMEAHQSFPVILITGPRQSGKTTLCRHLFPTYKFVNLELITMRNRANDDPEGFINWLGPCAIIDEAHNVPDILSVIQAKVDEDRSLRYILTGSSNFALMRNVSQSLAGRVAVFTLLPLSLEELGKEYTNRPTDQLEYTGFYPGVVACGQPADLFYESYLSTYIERDVRDLLKVKNLNKFEHFVRLCAGRVSSELNASALATEVGVSSVTIAEWLSILQASFIVFPLAPYYANIGKRLSKRPKLYFYDTGLMTHLLGITTYEQLETHPLRGAVFENLVTAEMMKTAYNAGQRPSLCFYRENSGKEVDLVQETASGINLFEVKSSMTYRKDFIANMTYLQDNLSNVNNCTLIYDGDTIAPDIFNFRDYFCH
ncbi:MAG: ATP-binding protein [Muribaculaceae bacterium]|nr:ATP-binding protein [Muribaculaceae bacterium]